MIQSYNITMTQNHESDATLPPIRPLPAVSLKAAGYGFLTGDAALFAAGWQEKNLKMGMAGPLWSLGGLAAAYYGNPQQEKQLELFTARLANYLRENNIAIPNNPTTAVLLKEQGLLDHIQQFLYKHPADILNVFSVLGGTQLAYGGMAKNFRPDMVSGALIAAGGLAGLLIQEKKPDPLHPPQGALHKAWSWVQEKPLRVTGGLQASNNIAMFAAAFAKRKQQPEQHSHALRFTAAASYLFANIMLFISSKQNDKSTNPETLVRLGELSAQVIAAQPKEVQEATLQHIAAHLATQPGNPNAEDIAAMLHQKLAVITQPTPNPAASWQARIAKNKQDPHHVK